MAAEITLDQLRTKALQAGLELADEELQKLLPGVNRARDQVTDLRQLVTDAAEPASTFIALKNEKA